MHDVKGREFVRINADITLLIKKSTCNVNLLSMSLKAEICLGGDMSRRSSIAPAAADDHGCQMAIAGFLESYVFGPSGFWTLAPLRCAAKFDPFFSLDYAPTPSTLAQSKERKR